MPWTLEARDLELVDLEGLSEKIICNDDGAGEETEDEGSGNSAGAGASCSRVVSRLDSMIDQAAAGIKFTVSNGDWGQLESLAGSGDGADYTEMMRLLGSIRPARTAALTDSSTRLGEEANQGANSGHTVGTRTFGGGRKGDGGGSGGRSAAAVPLPFNISVDVEAAMPASRRRSRVHDPGGIEPAEVRPAAARYTGDEVSGETSPTAIRPNRTGPTGRPELHQSTLPPPLGTPASGGMSFNCARQRTQLLRELRVRNCPTPNQKARELCADGGVITLPARGAADACP